MMPVTYLLGVAHGIEAHRVSVSAKGAPQDAAVREIRVLIGGKLDRIRARADGGLTINEDRGRVLGVMPADAWVEGECTSPGTIRWTNAAMTTSTGSIRMRGGSASLAVSLYQDGEWQPAVDYSGSFHLVQEQNGGFEVINDVDLEQYVGGVTACETWPTFHPEAYLAQAIVVRSYALYQMVRRQNASWDISACQGAQVYRGIRTDEAGRRGAEAARRARGVVCTWRDGDTDRLFSTYYSAACGGVSQSAGLFGESDNVPPLSGGVRCDYCRIAPRDTYRWGPVRLPVSEVMRRLSVRYQEAQTIGTLSGVAVLDRSVSGRPTRLRLTGSSGQTFDLMAEQFRLALGGNVVRSTDCEVRVVKDEVVFTEGRGFGHGLGLCQWGAQGLALAGKKAGDILRFYFPGSQLTRVY